MEGKVKRYFMLERESYGKRFWWSCATLCMLTREVIGLSSLWSLRYSYAPLVLWQGEIDDCNSSSSPPQPL